MKTAQQIDEEEKQKAVSEAKRLIGIFGESNALLFCEEMAKKMPNINDTPPIHRMPRENYMQFYMFAVPSEIKSTN